MDSARLDGPVSVLVHRTIEHGSVQDALDLLNLLRQEARRLDRYLSDPRHKWNRIDDGDR